MMIRVSNIAILVFILTECAYVAQSKPSNRTANQASEGKVNNFPKTIEGGKMAENRNEKRLQRQEMMRDMSLVALRQFASDAEQKALSCDTSQYFDSATQNCEDCATLCQHYSLKMCQIRCPTQFIVTQFHLMKIESDVEDLRSMLPGEADQGSIIAKTSDVAELTREVEALKAENVALAQKLFYSWIVTALVIVLLAACFAAIYINMRKRAGNTKPPPYDCENKPSSPIDSKEDSITVKTAVSGKVETVAKQPEDSQSHKDLENKVSKILYNIPPADDATHDKETHVQPSKGSFQSASYHQQPQDDALNTQPKRN